MATRSLRLADLLAGLSVATDLGFGLPREHGLRSCVIATTLARKMGVSDDQVTDAYYTALLEHVGSIAHAGETAPAFGDEPVMTAAGSRASIATPAGRAFTASTLVRGNRVSHRASLAVCEAAGRAAERLGLSTGVQRSLHEVFERWDGQGAPIGLGGDRIAQAGRIVRVASLAARFDVLGGTAAARDAVRRRSGSLLDPAIADSFTGSAEELLAVSRAGDPRQAVVDLEPAPTIRTGEAGLVDVATVFADLADAKTPCMHGHSRSVAALARAAGARLGLPDAELRVLEVAALLHDLGRVSVSNEIWGKRGPLTGVEWEAVRLHPYQTERILAGSSALAPCARLAGLHHERLDGSGYHRGCRAAELPRAARVLAAADAYEAMTHPRPHRPALSPRHAADELGREARAGRVDADAVAAVLSVRGRRGVRPKRDLRPAGLSAREVEVVALVAGGCSNKDVAAELNISPRTAEHHVQHIYRKVGVSSRPALALFAVEHDLLAGSGPVSNR